MKSRDLAALKALSIGQLPPGTPAEGLPHLRFDRVARRVVKSLQEALVGVPSEMAALVVTVTAPIRMPGRTVGELGARLHKSLPRNFDEMVCGNRVRARIVRCGVRGGPRVIVFVHNPDSAPTGLFRLVKASLSSTRQITGSTRSRKRSHQAGD
jgi:hypothetical protein